MDQVMVARLDKIPVGELFQLLLQREYLSRIAVETPDGQGEMVLGREQLWEATFRGLSGREAALEMLLLTDGLLYSRLADEQGSPPQNEGDAMTLMLESLRLTDHWQELSPWSMSWLTQRPPQTLIEQDLRAGRSVSQIFLDHRMSRASLIKEVERLLATGEISRARREASPAQGARPPQVVAPPPVSTPPRQRSTEVTPFNAAYGKGLAALHNEAWTEAAAAFTQALELDPQHFHARYYLNLSRGHLKPAAEGRSLRASRS